MKTQGNSHWKSQNEKLANFPAVNITLGFEVSVTTQQFLCSTKAATDSEQMNEYGCVPIKLYLQKMGNRTIPSRDHGYFGDERVNWDWNTIHEGISGVTSKVIVLEQSS